MLGIASFFMQSESIAFLPTSADLLKGKSFLICILFGRNKITSREYIGVLIEYIRVEN